MSRPERGWPRWWDIDAWFGLLVIVPAQHSLEKISRLGSRRLRFVLTALVILVSASVWWLYVAW